MWNTGTLHDFYSRVRGISGSFCNNFGRENAAVKKQYIKFYLVSIMSCEQVASSM